ncbi:probable LRR receptor-like serine/threonine-protein kinase At1g07650 isoform X2 [Cryptomeria japonica]|uniref:probable LRR receptor-like serine/threonine-protein kinase At1g07650 isoform X2 n=1 Tax=Cryptomeria japonica TaxID=3369 RepID=UPI0027DA68F8|nr:probable LRR receptor-like serine/threonine-protein kinase At1g07650 isoform X2 [Cryptomeria japonica]
MATICHVGLKFSLVMCISFFYILQTGNSAANITDPLEVKALIKINNKLQYIEWDFGEDPCSGKGSWNKSQEKGFANYVSCNCTLDGESFCHVTHILLKRQKISGMVPSEFADLTYLEELDLTGNYINGSIPVELGSLANLKNLSLGINRLSGYIPKELGNLSSLISLVVRSNNLSGQLPWQLSRLSNLEKMHIANNQFSGRIPTSFSRFKVLNDFQACSNNFDGEIPGFIAKWKNISTLRLQASSLKGPIPSNFSSLTKLKDLRISDLTGGGSDLSFVSNLNKLKTLVLRNALIYGEIPPAIGKFKKLEILDLAFNNLIGSIPDTFQVQTTKGYALEYLYLENNSLTGNLQDQQWLNKISHVDLSFNNYSGDFPSWLSGKTKLNLIGNSFNTNLSQNREEAYLQRSFICNKENRQDNLAINCGGKPWKSSNPSINYEEDENPTGASTFFLSPEKRWAVSNTGHFMDNSSKTTYLRKVSNLQSTTGNSTLYMTARSSSTSLRYYGLCLYNGQYKVQLHFAEIEFSSNKSFRSLGRRLFDVYIQGTRMLKNFNIEEAAGGPGKGVVKIFPVDVTKNYLEIHFLWAGRGTYDVPVTGTYGPLVSAIVITPEFEVGKRKRTAMVIGIVFGVVIFVGMAVCLSFIFFKKRDVMKAGFSDAFLSKELTTMKAMSNSFTLEEIRNATSDFHSENKIGEGGFGAVFKGILPDGKVVAVKQMFAKSTQGNREFLNEVGTISAVQHPNLVKLYGCCIEGKQLLLVYEYLVNNNLARTLFGPEEFRLNLNWHTRYNICLGVARGLAYLHEESRLRIVHRDIKATNILLDQDMYPKISDFGLAKLFDRDRTHVSTRVAGTIGYMAPEYALKGQLTEKADVYSFGIVALEVVSGRKHTEKKLQEEMVYLTEWTWHLYGENRQLDLIDVNLKRSSYLEEEVLRTINVGLLCIQANPTLRPSMSQVVDMLEGKIGVDVSHCEPPYLSSGMKNELAEESSLSYLEGPWEGSISSQETSVVKQQKTDDDNDENSLI